MFVEVLFLSHAREEILGELETYRKVSVPECLVSKVLRLKRWKYFGFLGGRNYIGSLDRILDSELLKDSLPSSKIS